MSASSAIILAILVIAAYVGIRLILLRLQGVSPTDVDLEWDPMSLASRAARAEQAGRFGEALLLYAAAGMGPEVLERMQSSLPNWPVRDTILAVTRELLDLEQRALNARTGIPAPVTNRLKSYLENAGMVVWTTANRVAAAGTLASVPPRGLQLESEKLARLLQAVDEARNSLADLTLSGGGTELQGVEQDFRKLSDVAESLATANVQGDGA